MNIRLYELQAIMAGNFLNLGMILYFLSAGNKVGILLVLASWCFAYLSAFATYNDEGGFVRWLPWLLNWACLICSGIAMLAIVIVLVAAL